MEVQRASIYSALPGTTWKGFKRDSCGTLQRGVLFYHYKNGTLKIIDTPRIFRVHCEKIAERAHFLFCYMNHQIIIELQPWCCLVALSQFHRNN